MRFYYVSDLANNRYCMTLAAAGRLLAGEWLEISGIRIWLCFW